MKVILVTGGSGFIGSNFIRMLLSAEPGLQVINLDAITYAGNLANLEELVGNPAYIFIRENICDHDLLQELFRRYPIDTVVHFAAETHVDRSIASPEQFILTNVLGTQTLLEVARQAWLEKSDRKTLEEIRFHHISTDEVYGSLAPGEAAFRETRPYQPTSPYAASKAASDHLVRAYGKTYGLPYTISNCSNNYGPYQYPEKLIPLTILNALTGKEIPIYGDGKQVRDWLFVQDHCEAILRILRMGKLGETYNIGGNNQPANLEIVETLCRVLDELAPQSAYRPHRQLIRFVTDRPGHDRRYAMDIRKITTELGWQPAHSLEAGLKETARWYLEHPEWVQAITQREDYRMWVEQNYADRGEVM